MNSREPFRYVSLEELKKKQKEKKELKNLEKNSHLPPKSFKYQLQPKSFQYLSLEHLEKNFDALYQQEIGKHGAENDSSKIPFLRQNQNSVARIVFAFLKQNPNKYPKEQLAMIATGMMHYLRLKIKKEEYSGMWAYVLDPDNSILHRHTNSVTGNPDEIGIHAALIEFRNCLHANEALTKQINAFYKIVDISKDISAYINSGLTNASLSQGIKQLAHRHAYWKEDIKQFANPSVKNEKLKHVEPVVKQGKLKMRDFGENSQHQPLSQDAPAYVYPWNKEFNGNIAIFKQFLLFKKRLLPRIQKFDIGQLDPMDVLESKKPDLTQEEWREFNEKNKSVLHRK